MKLRRSFQFIEPIHCGKKAKDSKKTESKAEDPGDKGVIQESRERGTVGKKQKILYSFHCLF